MSRLIFCLFTAFFAFSTFAMDASSVGYGKSEQEARANALSELSFVIYSDVSSSLSLKSDSDMNTARQKLSKQTDIFSSLPLFGTKVKMDKDGEGFKAEASIDGASIPSYKAALDDASSSIKLLSEKTASTGDSSLKYDMPTKLVSGIDSFSGLNRVYTFLSGASYGSFESIKSDSLEQLKKLSEKFTDMTLCAGVLAKELKEDGAYIYYPMYEESDEVTEFSSAFRKLMAGQMSVTDDLANAQYTVNTEYSVNDSGIYLVSSLNDKTGKTLKTVSAVLLPAAYKGLETKPSSIDFEKLIKMGRAESSDFAVRITTGQGKRAVMYHKGDVVEIFIKANRPCYAYVYGHVVKRLEKYSYLLDLYNADNDRRFIRYIDADEINRWLSLGKFRITAPYGTEVFQLMASIDDPSGTLPVLVYDKVSELYKLSGDPYAEVSNVRALARISDAAATAEDDLIFSSSER